MNAIVPLQGNLPAAFQAAGALPDMASAAQAGIQASFAVVGFKGKNWRIKHRGDDKLLLDQRGVPVPSLDVVIVGISPNISKIFYEGKFVEGQETGAPECFSVDGIKPDPAAQKKQAENCATCPMNIWGSRITDAGKKAKRCQDSRRIAVVPAYDVPNAGYGGPMLLRVPPTSLSALASYTADMQRVGAQPYMVRTQIVFDFNVAYPLFKFAALGWVDDQTAPQVVEAIQHPLIERMLSEAVEEATADPVPHPVASLALSKPPAAFTQAPATTVVVPEPVQQAVAPRDEMAELRAKLAAMEMQAQSQVPTATQQAAPVLEAKAEPILEAKAEPADVAPPKVVATASDDLASRIDALLKF